MAKNLVIVESPAKAKTIGQYLGKAYKIEASMGHIRDLPKSTIGIDVEKNFEPKYINIRGKGEIISRLKRESKAAENVYLATDPDREGEAISWHLAAILGIDEKKKCRITFNEITSSAVKNSVKAPREIDIKLVEAQQTRRILDRLVGYKISPILWRKIRKGLSAGRVQSVATRLICDREEEIDAFIPEEYWRLTAKLQKRSTKQLFDARYYGIGTGKRELKDKEAVDRVLSDIKDGVYTVIKVKKAEKRKSPSPPFITSTMQQDASRKLGFTAKRTMMAAQQLYEGVNIKGSGFVGLVTYIRTDSTRVSDESMNDARRFITELYGEQYLPKSVRTFKNRNSSQDAHEAVRPTRMSLTPDTIKASLSNDQYKLYKLIYERFAASQMANAVYDSVAVDIDVSGHTFRAIGSTVKFQGFMVIYTEGRDENNDEAEAAIPELEEGESLALKNLEPKQFYTQPPARYNEATLIKVLEEQGIGRPSTYAPIISTILDRGYVEKEKKYFKPTDLGKVVNDLMKKHFKDIVDIRFTAGLEKQLDSIEEGEKAWVDTVKEFYDGFSKELGTAENEIGKIKLPETETDIKCEKCGRNMVIKIGRFGKFLACPGFPECRNAKPIFEDAGVVCPKCGKKVVYKKAKNKKRYIVCEDYPNCSFISWDQPAGGECPKCGKFLVKKYIGKKPVIKCSDEACEYVAENHAAGKS